MKHMPAPCVACPFRKDIAPGALGGSSPTVYIGQTEAPFVLPCHKACDFDDPDWRRKALDETAQCAGAAIYRTHIGVADKMPKEIHTLPANPLVFSSHAEFLAHHSHLTVSQATTVLESVTPAELAALQMVRSSNIRKEMK